MSTGFQGAALPQFSASTPRDTARRQLAKAFAAAGIASADLDARVLLCAGLGIEHMDLVRDPDQPLGSAAEIIDAYAHRRMNREPVSRIIGYKEFWGERLALDPHVLDPRPDTECLVEAVLKTLGDRMSEPLRIVDLGVGSGAILCALLRSFPESSGVGIDISPRACAVARENLMRWGLGARGHIVCGNWSEALRGPFDLVVSNPPYIIRNEIGELDKEVRDHDPRLALDGGEDGFSAYREIIPDLARMLAPGGLVAFEIGPAQAGSVALLLEGADLGATAVALDLAGRERIILAQGSGSMNLEHGPRGPEGHARSTARARDPGPSDGLRATEPKRDK